jgi:hypothetical protein
MLASALLALKLGGCASSNVGEGAVAAHVPAGRYVEAFEAARESLVDLGFELDRVDARLGIITSRPKPSVGLASPWDREQSTVEQEFEDLLNRQYRRAVITFHVPDAPEHSAPRAQTAPGAAPADLREHDDALTARVEVVLERFHRPGWRLEPSAMRFSSRSFDPDLRGTGMWPQYTVAFSQDILLARRLAESIDAATRRTAAPSEAQ